MQSISEGAPMTNASRNEQPRASSAGAVLWQRTPSPSSALRPLARLAVGRSGADIERTDREARRSARRAGRSLEWDDLAHALCAARLYRPEPLRWRMAVHEAAHALVHLVVGSGNLSIISIEADNGGIVRVEPQAHVPETEASIMAQIVVRLAGRAAEEIVFGDPVVGSGGSSESDLAIATELAIMLETSLGFGSYQRLVYRDVSDRSHILTLDARLAAAVHQRLEACYEQARAILKTEGEPHLWLAKTLLHHGVLEGAELAEVVAEVQRRLSARHHDRHGGGGPT
jgi:ATP-dependent Zn protease